MISKEDYNKLYTIDREEVRCADELDKRVDRALMNRDRTLAVPSSDAKCYVSVDGFSNAVITEVCHRLAAKGWMYAIEADDRDGRLLIIW